MLLAIRPKQFHRGFFVCASGCHVTSSSTRQTKQLDSALGIFDQLFVARQAPIRRFAGRAKRFNILTDRLSAVVTVFTHNLIGFRR